MLDDLMEAAPFVPSVLVAALISLFVTTLAIGLLVIPGMWLYTRWSLATPVIREEGIGPVAATRRSNQLVRGHFWFGTSCAKDAPDCQARVRCWMSFWNKPAAPR